MKTLFPITPIDVAFSLGIRYDGVQSFGRSSPPLAQFTDIHEPKTPAYGATFYVPFDEVTEMAVLGAWALMVKRFSKV